VKKTFWLHEDEARELRRRLNELRVELSRECPRCPNRMKKDD